jgi:hypothetical protein
VLIVYPYFRDFGLTVFVLFGLKILLFLFSYVSFYSLSNFVQVLISIKRTMRFYTTILIHYILKVLFQPADNERLRRRGKSINDAHTIVGGLSSNFLLTVILAVATALHDLTTSTLAAIVVDHFVLRTWLVLKAFEPRVDVAKFDELGVVFLEDAIDFLVQNIELTDYAGAGSDKAIGCVVKILPVVSQRLSGPHVDTHAKGRVLVDND